MAENDSSSSVASVAIVVILLIALAVGYFVFVRGVSAKRGIDIDINVPDKIDRPLPK
jgi:hypothetical protein